MLKKEFALGLLKCPNEKKNDTAIMKTSKVKEKKFYEKKKDFKKNV